MGSGPEVIRCKKCHEPVTRRATQNGRKTCDRCTNCNARWRAKQRTCGVCGRTGSHNKFSFSIRICNRCFGRKWYDKARRRRDKIAASFKNYVVDGMKSGENIYIDPRPAIPETLLHELLHRRKPRWSERAVSIAARNMSVQMSDETRAKWWGAYRRTRKRGCPVEPAEGDK